MTTTYLFAWMTPRVRSASEAERVLQGPDDAFGETEKLLRLGQELSADPRITLDNRLGRSPDRFVIVMVSDGDLPDVGPEIARRCTALGLVLFDPQHRRLVVPRRAGAPPWPEPERGAMAKLRSELSSVRPTGDRGRDREAMARQTAAHVGRFSAHHVPMPLDVPADLGFAVPIVAMDQYQTDQALTKLMAKLAGGRPESRRAAASTLGGWPSQPDIGRALLVSLKGDPDPYVRALAALSLAAQGYLDASRYRSRAADLLRELLKSSPNEQAGIFAEAASIALLAAAVAAARLRDPTLCETVAQLAVDVSRFPGQLMRAQSIREALGRAC